MKKVVLKLYDIVLAEIIDKNGLELVVNENQENIKQAKEIYPLNMRAYTKGLSGYVYPIESFFSAFNRKDIIKESGINEDDSVFEKLYKVAGLDLIDFNGFIIRQE